MKKLLFVLLIAVFALFGLSACSDDDGGEFSEQPELTLYANGGLIWMGSEEPYDVELGAYAIEDTMKVFADALVEKIDSVKKDGAEFAGWKVYAVKSGEWVTEEVTDVKEGELCAPCGDYGYYYMKDYEVLSEKATTAEMLALKFDGRNYYAVATWK